MQSASHSQQIPFIISSQVILLDACHIAVYEIWPPARHYKKSVAFGAAFLSFLASIPLTLRGGMDILLSLYAIGSGLPLLVNSALAILIFCHIHGNNFSINDQLYY